MIKNYNNFLQILLFVVFLSILPSAIYAQCAGDDAAFEVCDVPNPVNQTINLFTKLGGTPLTGGVWKDVDGSDGLDPATGILNIHKIRISGIFRYTYTVDGVNGCTDNSATVVVTVGGYSGVSSPNVTVCSASLSYNLFNAFSGLSLGPQSNGQWHNDTTNENITGSVINIQNLEGDFQFTYTMPAIGTCPAMSSTAVVSVRRAPRSGTGIDLNLCVISGLSNYRNYNLNDALANEDNNGTWTDNSNTGELTSAGDRFIDIEKIYNTFGAGVYSFTYNVLSSNTICPDVQTTILIRLRETIDFTGAVLVVSSDICESEIPTAQYSVTVTKGPAPVPNGFYTVTYSVQGTVSGVETTNAAFTNGVLRFPINAAYFRGVGRFKVTILNMNLIGSFIDCGNIISNLSDDLIISANPNLVGAVITPGRTCQNEDTTLKITNATKLADGTYDIIYNVRGSNTANSQIARITSVGGVVNDFIVPGILSTRSGTSIILITAITQADSPYCVNSADLSGEILIDPLPSAAGLTLQIQNVCFGEPVSVAVSGLGLLTDVTLSYTLSGSNTSTLQTIVLPNVVNGNASFTLPPELLLNSGSTTVSISNFKNNTTTCAVDVTGNLTSFTINPIPAAPVITSPQEFCKVEKATIANLQPNGAQYKWYISATSDTPLANTYELQSEDYYVRVTSPTNCTSEASQVSVIINDPPAPQLNDAADFCGLDNPTISDLSGKTNSPSTVVWYDAPNGNLLPSTTPLTDKTVYYAYDFITATGCISENNLLVTVSLIDCNSPQYPFFVPDGFSPNGDGVNDVFVIPNIDFLYPDYTIEIFNRYGNGMYKGGKDKPGWDGINYERKGLSSGVAPNGVYFYIINFNKDNKPPQQGRLYLNR